jgi:hypothetical protein
VVRAILSSAIMPWWSGSLQVHDIVIPRICGSLGRYCWYLVMRVVLGLPVAIWCAMLDL